MSHISLRMARASSAHSAGTSTPCCPPIPRYGKIGFCNITGMPSALTADSSMPPAILSGADATSTQPTGALERLRRFGEGSHDLSGGRLKKDVPPFTCVPRLQVDLAFGKFFTDNNLDRQADQIRVVEFNSRACLPVVQQRLVAQVHQLALETCRRLRLLRPLRGDDDDLHRKWGNRLGPPDARLVVVLLHHSLQQARCPNAIGAHYYGAQHPVSIGELYLQRPAVLRARLEDVSDLYAARNPERALSLIHISEPT